MQSCVKRPIPHSVVDPCDGEFQRLFSAVSGDSALNIRGRVRIDLPRYRVRGLCTIRSTPAGDVRIDFHHSSLFGSYREDATIFLRHGRLGILDRERSFFFGNDSTLAMLRDHLGFDVHPDDIAHVLLLACPPCDEIDSPRMHYRSADGDWRFSGIWRGRRVEVEGRSGGRPISFRQCREDNALCYVARYTYDNAESTVRYPSGITLSREYGSERIALEVRDLKRDIVGEAVFGLFDSLAR